MRTFAERKATNKRPTGIKQLNVLLNWKKLTMLGGTFDPESELLIHEHFRPHWSQAGAIVFITFRTHDSIPREVVERWDRDKQDWLTRNGLANAELHWSKVIPLLENEDRVRFNRQFDRCREDFLDTCRGSCVLKRHALAQIVADSLLHFDGERYRMGDFIVMPNHVHLMAAFGNQELLVKQCDSWLHFTAFKINRQLGQKGKFWQQEPFDHLLRSPEQYEYLRNYIRDNPKKAGLKHGEYLYREHT
jgi:putative transposase